MVSVLNSSGSDIQLEELGLECVVALIMID